MSEEQQAAPGQGKPSQEIAQRGWITQLVESRAEDFTKVVPAHVSVEAFMGLAVAYIRRDEKLREVAKVNPGAVILALRECAALGHVPQKGIFALVPFNNRRAVGGKDVAGIEEVRGVIQRMFRAGGVQAVKVQLVREKDHCRWNPSRMTLPEHEFDVFADDEARGPLKAVYAWAVMLSGAISQVVFLNRSQVMRYKAVAKTDAFWSGPWEPEMWEKTALHRLEKFVPTSAGYQWQLAASAAGASTGFGGLPDVPAGVYGGAAAGGVMDAEIVEESGGREWDDVQTAQPGSGVPAGGGS